MGLFLNKINPEFLKSSLSLVVIAVCGAAVVVVGGRGQVGFFGVGVSLVHFFLASGKQFINELVLCKVALSNGPLSPLSLSPVSLSSLSLTSLFLFLSSLSSTR